MKQYRFLLFDADYTLLDFDADMLMAFRRLYRHCGYEQITPYSQAMLDTYEKHNTNWWTRFDAGQCTKEELFRGRFADFLAETGLPGDAGETNRAYFDFLGSGGILYDGAAGLLDTLKDKYKIYIVTNGNAATAKTRIQNSGLYQYIEDYFVSEAVGYAKPNIRYFDYVFSNIPGFRKEEAIMIGDSLLNDIQGAQNAGIDSIWYDRPQKWRQDNPDSYSFTCRAESYDDILRYFVHE